MKLYLLRHAESISNLEKRADSQIDSELSVQGLKDADTISLKLREIQPDIFFISPLKRTLLTIQPYLKSLNNPTVITSPLLLERNAGIFTGTPLGSFKKYCEANNLNKVITRPENGESILDVCDRVKNFWSEIKNKYLDKRILICGSQVNLLCMQIIIENKDIMDFYTYEQFKNMEIREFDIE